MTCLAAFCLTAATAQAQSACATSDHGFVDGSDYKLEFYNKSAVRKLTYTGETYSEGSIVLMLRAPRLLPDDHYSDADPKAVLTFHLKPDAIWSVDLQLPKASSKDALFDKGVPIAARIELHGGTRVIEGTSKPNGERRWTEADYESGFGKIVAHDVYVRFYDGRSADRSKPLAEIRYPAAAFIGHFARTRKKMADFLQMEREGRCVPAAAS
ncbi:hypothetical protein [Sphingopyxis sp. PET50]|uniref:hypothetical protein n=1 Tax=Sphingopyxis sp. PET50 TaxID=2976533 RepID=UPI0021AE8CC6|nr:hypothetical protein [Sphingopyxis sp. PET50]